MWIDLLYNLGYPGLFLCSFLAATLLPLSSEIVITSMAVSSYSPSLLLITATAGNSLGAVFNYYVGKHGASWFFSRYIVVEREKRQRMEQLYARWGAPVLFFSWAPIIGDPLAIIAGACKVKLSIFLFWVILGKGLRYFAILTTASTFLPLIGT